MDQKQITEWERQNQSDIIGWEVAYGYKNTAKKWIPYIGYAMVIFEMVDGSKKEFKRENTGMA